MDYCSTRSHAVEILYVGSALDVAEPIPQSSLDRFHIHREPSRLANSSTIQNDKSCRPSPCGWLSQPRTTTAAPPLVCLIGENLGQHCWPGCVITLLKRASLVPLLILKRPRLGFDVYPFRFPSASATDCSAMGEATEATATGKAPGIHRPLEIKHTGQTRSPGTGMFPVVKWVPAKPDHRLEANARALKTPLQTVIKEDHFPKTWPV